MTGIEHDAADGERKRGRGHPLRRCRSRRARRLRVLWLRADASGTIDMAHASAHRSASTAVAVGDDVRRAGQRQRQQHEQARRSHRRHSRVAGRRARGGTPRMTSRFSATACRSIRRLTRSMLAALISISTTALWTRVDRIASVGPTAAYYRLTMAASAYESFQELGELVLRPRRTRRNVGARTSPRAGPHAFR